MNKYHKFALLLCLYAPLTESNELGITYGYGIDTLDYRWSVSGNIYGTSPNIMSELSWNNLQGNAHHLGLEFIASSGWMGRSTLQMNEFNQGGQVQDSDYLYDNRTGEFSRSFSLPNGSNSQDLTLLAGHKLSLNESQNISITPIIGISRNLTELRMVSGKQTIPASTSYPNLDNRYRAQFDAILAGVEACWWMTPTLGLDLKWHHAWLNYHAEADWNLRTDFQHPVSFYHDGKGSDNRWTIGLLGRINNEWQMELAYTFRQGSLQNGIDVVNLSNGSQQRTLLKEVEWSTTSTSLLAHRIF